MRGPSPALETLVIFHDDDVINKNKLQAIKISQALALLKAHPKVAHFRQQGMIWAFDAILDDNAARDFSRSFTACALKNKLLLRPIGRTVLLPPIARADRTLATDYDSADLAQQLGLPVILVVGMRLGCLSHALLSAEAIAARCLVLASWVANHITTDMPYHADNIASLTRRLPAPLLGCVPYMATPSTPTVAAALNLRALEFILFKNGAITVASLSSACLLPTALTSTFTLAKLLNRPIFFKPVPYVYQIDFMAGKFEETHVSDGVEGLKQQIGTEGQ